MEFKIVNVEPRQAIGIRDNCTAAALSQKFMELYTEISPVMKAQSLKHAGPAFGIYHSFSQENVDMEAGFIVDGNPKPEGRVKVFKTYGGKAACAKYIGPYTGLGEAWAEFGKWIADNKHKITGACFEFYMTDPQTEPDSSKWITDLYFPIA